MNAKNVVITIFIQLLNYVKQHVQFIIMQKIQTIHVQNVIKSLMIVMNV